MAILLEVDDPQALVDAIYSDINDESIDTWKYNEKRGFTHSAKQWINKAWLNPVLFNHPNNKMYNLCFRFVPSTTYDKKEYQELYGIYHGRFSEMLIVHFSKDIKVLRLTPLPLKDYDIV